MTSMFLMKDFLVRKGFIHLGSGCQSSVFGRTGSDRVIKVCAFADGWQDYVTWAAEAGYAGGLAPRVTSLKMFDDSYLAVVERMAMTGNEAMRSDDTPDSVKRVLKDFSGVLIGRKMLDHASSKDYALHAPDAENFVDDIRAQFCGCEFDIMPGGYTTNIMVRGDGSICVTDPFYRAGLSSSFPSRMRERDFSRISELRIAA
jgi:hypothetical protein